MAETIGKLAYDEGVRSITSQASVLDNLRARAGTLIAVASLVTSFLGGQALAKPTLSGGALVRQDIETFGWVAIGAFVLVAIMAIAILWPYTWRFVMSSKTILDSGVTYEVAQAGLAEFHEENYDSNRRILDKLWLCFQLGCVFLVVETLAWIIELSR